jgi:hypothetical protein
VKKKPPKPATKKARRKAAVKRLARPSRAHKKHPLENVADRIGRKLMRKTGDLLGAITAPIVKELEELDTMLGDDEE